LFRADPALFQQHNLLPGPSQPKGRADPDNATADHNAIGPGWQLVRGRYMQKGCGHWGLLNRNPRVRTGALARTTGMRAMAAYCVEKAGPTKRIGEQSNGRVAPTGDPRHRVMSNVTKFKLDRIDVNILAALQRNGRITNVELSEIVNLSPSPCLMRVKRLQKAGYISGYMALIDVSKLGETLTVFTEFTLKNHRQVDFARFQEALEKIDSCVECYLVSGGYDYLVKFVTTGISDYQNIVEALIDRDIGIDKYFSYVVMKTPFVNVNAEVKFPRSAEVIFPTFGIW
jgi:DNA-binding Lrp family transcriptional regulator